MDPNDADDDEDNDFDVEIQNIFDSIVLWLDGQNNLRSDESAGEPSTGGIFDTPNPNEDVINIRGENVPPDTSMFKRMRQVFQYQASVELLKSYTSNLNQKLQQDKRTSEDDITISDLLTLSQTDTLISRANSWCLESSGSSYVEPSSTESEIYEISPSESANEELGVKTLHSNDCIFCNKIKNTSQQEGPVESIDLNLLHNFDNDVNSNEEVLQNNDESNEENNPLESNLLLQACILDINDATINPIISQLLAQMLPYIFNNHELQIIRHFVRYKIRTSLEEINQRIRDLQTREAQRRVNLRPSNESENNDSNNFIWSSNTSVISSDPELGMRNREFQEIGLGISRISLPPFSEESRDVSSPSNTSSSSSSNPGQELRNTPEIHEVFTQDVTNDIHEVSPPVSDISLQEQSCECEGRTTQVLQIMYQMLGLTNIQRYRMLKLHEHLLSDTEYNAVLDYIESAQDLGFMKRNCMMQFLSHLQSWYYRRKRSNKRKNCLTRLQFWTSEDVIIPMQSSSVRVSTSM